MGLEVQVVGTGPGADNEQQVDPTWLAARVSVIDRSREWMSSCYGASVGSLSTPQFLSRPDIPPRPFS